MNRLRGLQASLVTGLALGCYHPQECRRDRECEPGSVCVDNGCQAASMPCADDEDCDEPDTCVAGLCLRSGRCHLDLHCSPGSRCDDGLCIPLGCPAVPCDEGMVCAPSTGRCEPYRCRSNADCEAPEVCDAIDGECRRPEEIQSQEICDGRDNDLDGAVDEGFMVGEPCKAGIGECERFSFWSCTADGRSRCGTAGAPPQTELCDKKDNDCDGEYDEDYVNLGLICETGDSGVCAPGLIRCSSNAMNTICDRLIVPGQLSEACDNLDNDCNGATDEIFAGLGEPCAEGLGICRAFGTLVCDDDQQSVRCTAIPLKAGIEVCDALDNDCDGEVDEEGC